MSQSANSKLELSSIDIERIVREVLASVMPAIPAPSASPSANPSAASSATTSPVAMVKSYAVETIPQSIDAMHLNVSVLSLDSLRSVPSGTKQITVSSTALVTPAAKDWLREKGIGWTRIIPTASSPDTGRSSALSNPSGPSTSVASSEFLQKNSMETPPKRVLVTGSVLWLRTLEKQLCPKSSQIDQVQLDDASSLRAVAQAIRNGTPAAIAVVKAPHATLWQAARDEALRPSIVSQWSDLTEVLQEVPTNLLILSASRWNTAGTANIARKFIDHLRANR
jgi:hypothetical protein